MNQLNRISQLNSLRQFDGRAGAFQNLIKSANTGRTHSLLQSVHHPFGNLKAVLQALVVADQIGVHLFDQSLPFD